MRNIKPDKGRYNLRSGLVILPVQHDAIDQTLTELAHKLPAYFLLLTDVTGQVVASQGEQGQKDLVALGSLVAGDLAASQEIARLTSQYQDYQMVLREGQKMHTFIVEASHHLALLVQVSREVPLGWARMLIQKAAHRLTDIVASPRQEDEQQQLGLELDEEGLLDLFNNALNDVWKE